MVLACFLLVGAACDKLVGSGEDDEPADKDDEAKHTEAVKEASTKATNLNFTGPR
jgi:hypothetical protein